MLFLFAILLYFLLYIKHVFLENSTSLPVKIRIKIAVILKEGDEVSHIIGALALVLTTITCQLIIK